MAVLKSSESHQHHHHSAMQTVESRRDRIVHHGKGLFQAILPQTGPGSLSDDGAGQTSGFEGEDVAPEVIARLARFEETEARLERPEPFDLGTDEVLEIVPPLPGAGLRAASGAATMADYLLDGNAWQLLLNKYLKTNSQVLEIGCGSGMVARNFAYHPSIRNYIGFDLDHDGVEFCKRELAPRAGENFEFHHLDASRVVFPADEGSIDLAWSASLIAGLPQHEARNYLREARRVLTPSGLFLAAIRFDLTSDGPDSGDDVGKRCAEQVAAFEQIAAAEGLTAIAKLGMIYDGYAMLFKSTPGSVAPKIVNVGGVKSDDEIAEASKPKAVEVPIPQDAEALSGEMLRLNAIAAKKVSVPSIVHPSDFIYWFLATRPEMSLGTSTNYYFEDGARSADKLARELTGLFGIEKTSISLLEFASGYGCVSRHLKKNPRFDLTSCDIHPDAIHFLTHQLGVNAIQSAHKPEDFAPPRKYDAIFALSFFSHMPKSTFGRWVKALYNALNAPGYLLFTTHGVESCKHMHLTLDDIPADGIWFKSHSQQHDLDAEEYGMTVSLERFVAPEVLKQTGAPITAFKQAEWWSHQDLWIVKRDR